MTVVSLDRISMCTAVILHLRWHLKLGKVVWNLSEFVVFLIQLRSSEFEFSRNMPNAGGFTIVRSFKPTTAKLGPMMRGRSMII